MNLIDYPDQWDAMQIICNAQSQVWDETLAVVCPSLDSRRDVIPQQDVKQVFESPAYCLLNRVENRLRQTWKEGK